MKILFLDDDNYRHKKMRQNSIGFSVDFAFDAEEAIELMIKNEYCLIMLDHDLDIETLNQLIDSEKDGRYVASWMAEDGRHKEVTVIIHSLNTNGADCMKTILKNAGFKDVINLPFAWLFISKTDKGTVFFDFTKKVALEDYR